MERVKGRPQNMEGRLDKEIRVYDFLDSLGIEYERVDHEPAMTIEACEEIDQALEAVICKNLFLCNRQETDFYLLMIPGENLKQRIFPRRLVHPDFLLENRNTWSSFLILPRVQ